MGGLDEFGIGEGGQSDPLPTNETPEAGQPIRPGDKGRLGYGPPAPLPEDAQVFPSASARDIDTKQWHRRYADAFRFKTSEALARIALWILPIVPLAKFNPESYWPDEILAFNQGAATAGGAGNFSRVALYNPGNSQVLAIVTSIAATLIAAGTVQIGINILTPLAVTTNSFARDTRQGLTAPKCYIHTDNGGTAQFDNGPFLNRSLGAQGTLEWTGGDDNPVAILAPGSGIVVTPSAAATQMIAEFRWRERSIFAAGLPSS